MSFPQSITDLCPVTASSLAFPVSLTRDKHKSVDWLRTNWSMHDNGHGLGDWLRDPTFGGSISHDIKNTSKKLYFPWLPKTETLGLSEGLSQ